MQADRRGYDHEKEATTMTMAFLGQRVMLNAPSMPFLIHMDHSLWTNAFLR